jgi:tRNA-uridine 2-sulfurtransferase
VLLHTVTWVDGTRLAEGGDPAKSGGSAAIAQCSAHGRPVPCTLHRAGDSLSVAFATPQRRVAPGQTVALYDPDHPDAVIGSGIAG